MVIGHVRDFANCFVDSREGVRTSPRNDGSHMNFISSAFALTTHQNSQLIFCCGACAFQQLLLLIVSVHWQLDV